MPLEKKRSTEKKRKEKENHKALSLFCLSAVSDLISMVSSLASFASVNFIPLVFQLAISFTMHFSA